VPGFGFSGPAHDTGWDVPRIARAWAELMRRLGYERYGAQGGDYGSLISPALGRVAPDKVIGVHVNALADAATATGSGQELAGLSEADRAKAIANQMCRHRRFGRPALPGVRVVVGQQARAVRRADRRRELPG
jgi:pimeloyl-ACP methyl ester carboxylesterase